MPQSIPPSGKVHQQAILDTRALEIAAQTKGRVDGLADTMAQIHESLRENERRNSTQHAENQQALKDGLNTVHKRLDRKDKDDAARALKVAGWIITKLTAAMGALMYGAPWG
jgi:C4-dicarboxylate-specific signal transduction histidine kinase